MADVPKALSSLLDGLLELPFTEPGRQDRAAVLALFSDEADPDLVFTVRAANLRDQPGQISFPGGVWEPHDAHLAATALRETQEEVGIDPADVHLLGALPDRLMAFRGLTVTPVIGWWSGQVDEAVADWHEVAAVRRWRVSELVNTSNRVTATLPNGYRGPAWRLGDQGEEFLWGFTAGIVDRLLHLGGWHQPWDESLCCPVPSRFRRPEQR